MALQAPAPAKPALRSVTIALDILDAFFADAEIGLSELARRVGVTKSTMHRTCGVLVDRGALGAHEHGQVPPRRAPARVRATGHHAFGSAHTGVPAAGRAAQRHRRDGATRRALRRATCCTSNASKGLGALRFTIEAFRRSPVHRSSAGKAIAAFRPEVAAARIKAGMKPYTGHTIVIPKMLLEELAQSPRAWLRDQHRRERDRAVVDRRADP